MRRAPKGPVEVPSEGLDLFDGDAYLNALRLPAVTLNGRTHVGRLLGFPEWLRFAARLNGPAAGVAGDEVVDARRFSRLVRDVTVAVFGRGRPWWAVWRPTIAQQLVAAPVSLQIAALKSFSRSQMEAFAADAERLQTATGPTTDATPPTTTT
jgi:hypothetical protein